MTNRDELEAAMPFTMACFNEAMRMYPTVHMTTRLPQKDVQIGEHKIKKGTAVGISILGMHRNEKYFPEPDVYRPERHLPGPEKDKRP